jgi:aromatic-L-amino-acid decarboxylase
LPSSIVEEKSLEVSATSMRQWMMQAMDYIVPYFETMSKIPMKDLSGIESIKNKIREPLPHQGESLDHLLKLIFEELLPKGIQVHNPGYLAYIPVGSVFHASLAEFITFAINRWAGIYQYAPGLLEIEHTVILWLCEMMGLPAGSGGVLTSGGSLANFAAIITARHTHFGEEFYKGTIYFSKEAHHSIEKSARLAGFPKRNLKMIETDSNFRISIAELERKIADDRRHGLQPFMVVGNAGSTGTGAIDDLAELAKICKREKLWFHIDAAWAGSFRLTQNGKKFLANTALGDSVTIDPHKALYTPFGCGALLVRDPKLLKEAHSFEAGYLPGESEEEALMSPSKLSPELSRNIRGLQLWLPIKMLGIKPFVDTLEEKLKLVDWITAELRKIKGVEIVFAPQTAIVGFRCVVPNKDLMETNALNKKILERINSHQKVLLSSIEPNGIFTIRVVPFGQRTHFTEVKLVRDYIEEAVSYFLKG